MIERVHFKIEFDSSNQALVDDPIFETINILNNVKRDVNNGADGGVVKDSNGNTIGRWCLTIDED